MTDWHKLVLGLTVTVGLLVLAGAVALGHVEEKSSFGLTGILTILGKVALDFSQWAFRVKPTEKDKDD